MAERRFLVIGHGRTLHRPIGVSMVPACGSQHPKHLTELHERPVREATDAEVVEYPLCRFCEHTVRPRARISEAQREADEEAAVLFAVLPPLSAEELDGLQRALRAALVLLLGEVGYGPPGPALCSDDTAGLYRSLLTAVMEARYQLDR